MPFSWIYCALPRAVAVHTERKSAPPRACRNSGLDWRDRLPLVAFMRPFEPLGEEVQARVAKALRLDLAHCGKHVTARGPRAPMPSPDVMKLLFQVEPAGILRVAAVDHVDERAHAPLGLAGDDHVAPGLAIHHGDLLARAQVGDGPGPQRALDPIGDAAAGAADVEAEHEPGSFRRAAMHERIDAERAMQADQPRRRALEMRESGPPHQRAVGEDPEVLVGVLECIDRHDWEVSFLGARRGVRLFALTDGLAGRNRGD